MIMLKYKALTKSQKDLLFPLLLLYTPISTVVTIGCDILLECLYFSSQCEHLMFKGHA